VSGASRDGPAVVVWDLREIGRQLVAMKIDWDLPPFARARASADGPTVVTAGMVSVEPP
jgi:hypothetical protein